MAYFNGVKLTEETIIETREHFADINRRIIEDVESGKDEVNSPAEYIEWLQRSSEEYLRGDNDGGVWFLQRAHYLQTGESVALLG